jgi:hypothetical protein
MINLVIKTLVRPHTGSIIEPTRTADKDGFSCHSSPLRVLAPHVSLPGSALVDMRMNHDRHDSLQPEAVLMTGASFAIVATVRHRRFPGVQRLRRTGWVSNGDVDQAGVRQGTG